MIVGIKEHVFCGYDTVARYVVTTAVAIAEYVASEVAFFDTHTILCRQQSM